jgi:hypothetical protein
MRSEEKSKDRVIHFGAIIFLIIAIIIFIGVMFIAFDINLGELFSSKEDLKVTVMNDYDETLFVECAFYYDIGEDNPALRVYKGGSLEPGKTYVFTHEYEKTNRIVKTDVAVYTSSDYNIEKRTAYEDYEFSSNDCYNLLAVISESGDTITITKLSES